MPRSKSCVFLPSYVLDFLDDKSFKFDPDAFLSKATNDRLLEIILAFYPHFIFTQKAKEDHNLLRKIFIEMVAPRFNNLAIPSPTDTKYLQAPLLRFPSCLVEEYPKKIDSISDIDSERMSMFNIYGLSNLRAGLFRHAAESINTFIETYQFLNEDEVYAIAMIGDISEDNLNDSVTNLKQSHQSIERLQLDLCQSTISAKKREELENQLKHAMALLQFRQKTFDRTVQEVGFISALTDYHTEILEKNTPSPPKPSTQDIGEETQAPSSPRS